MRGGVNRCSLDHVGIEQPETARPGKQNGANRSAYPLQPRTLHVAANTTRDAPAATTRRKPNTCRWRPAKHPNQHARKQSPTFIASAPALRTVGSHFLATKPSGAAAPVSNPPVASPPPSQSASEGPSEASPSPAFVAGLAESARRAA